MYPYQRTFDGGKTINEEVKIWLSDILEDPITSILLKYSNLTKTQFESILIDLSAEILSTNEIRYEDKAKMRGKGVSRGAFNRSLIQARKNIISSIYTVLLLSYIGLFRGPIFEEYENLAENLREYKGLYRSYEIAQTSRPGLLSNIERELLEGIAKLAKPRKLKVS